MLEFSVAQCEAILRAAERHQARQARLDLRVFQHAIVGSFSEKGLNAMNQFAKELVSVLETPAPANTLAEDLNANRRAAVAALKRLGAQSD